MDNGKKRYYFYIGLFFLIGLALMFGAIVFFSSKLFTRDIVYAETYFNESVEGLSNGSTIKYLGMQIGKIEKISTVDNVYMIPESSEHQKEGKYIYVKMAIYPVFFSTNSKDDLSAELTKMINNGLRAKLSLQGLTGGAYIDMHFVSPSSSPPLPISWTPENYYIPSEPSKFTQFTDNVQYLLQELREADIKKMLASFRDLIDTATKTADDASKFISTADKTADNTSKLIANTNSQAAELLDSLRSVSQNLQQVSEQIKINPSSTLFSEPPKPLDLDRIGN